LAGSDTYNQQLGMRRSKVAVAYLVSKGINAKRLQAIITMGEEMPMVDTDLAMAAKRPAIPGILVEKFRVAMKPDCQSIPND